jgi:hypothetical protein
MCMYVYIYIVMWQSDYRRGFGLEILFIDYFNTRLVTTLNYSAIADLHTLQNTKSAVFPRRSPATVSNSGGSTAPALTSLLNASTKYSLQRLPYNSELLLKLSSL